MARVKVRGRKNGPSPRSHAERGNEGVVGFRIVTNYRRRDADCEAPVRTVLPVRRSTATASS